jgi:hypothetical protein
VDESLQARPARSILAGLLHFPTALAVLQLLVVLARGLGGDASFRDPAPGAGRGLHGSEALIESAVTLQTLAGSPVVAVRSLLESVRREVLERMHAPPGLDAATADTWLDARRRGSDVPTSGGLRAEGGQPPRPGGARRRPTNPALEREDAR